MAGTRAGELHRVGVYAQQGWRREAPVRKVGGRRRQAGPRGGGGTAGARGPGGGGGGGARRKADGTR